MSRGTSLLAKVNSTLRKFTPLTYSVYKRTITRAGGNDLIGRAGTTTNVDTLLDPQPFYENVSRKALSGGRDRTEVVATTSTERTLADYRLLMSPSAMTLAEIQNRNVMLVFKDNTTGTEVELLQILDFTPVAMQSTDVLYTIFARTVRRA